MAPLTSAQRTARWVAKQKAKHPERYRRSIKKSNLKQTWGLTLEEFERKRTEQNNKCACCEDALTEPHVDHNHATGQLRALLCQTCNTGLGHFKDDITRLAKAIRYLQGEPIWNPQQQ